jgi:hypothetical protein
MQEVFEAELPEDPKDVNDEDFFEACEEEWTEDESDFSNLESTNIEKLSGINFNEDGSY